jgi:hypothetical protein
VSAPLAWASSFFVVLGMVTTSVWRRHRVLDEQGASVVTHDELHAAQIRQALATPRDGATR